MYQKIIILTSIYFIIQLCFVMGFPTPGNPYGLPKYPPGTEEEEDVPPPYVMPRSNAKPATEKGAKDETNSATKAAEQVKQHDTQPGVPPQLSPDEVVALMKGLQANSPPPQTPTTQLLSLLAANSQNPDALQNIVRLVPNAGQFTRSLLAGLGPASQISQNNINGLMDIHKKNRQPGVDLMRSLTEPAAIFARTILAPTPFGKQFDSLRSLSMKSVSDNVDNAAQGSYILASTVPEGMQSFQSKANGLMDMSPLTF